MGTRYNVTIVGLQTADNERVHQAIERRLVEINQSMSTYIEDSELSLINRSNAPSTHQISNDLGNVLNIAIEIGSVADQYFDITVLPLVELWGFGASETVREVPDEADLEVALSLVGWDKFELNSLTLRRFTNVQIDLSAIAKGYGVDAIGELLTSLGYSHYLVEIGGEIVTSGVNSRGKLWRVGIEQPTMAGGSPLRAVTLNNEAVATSGDYRNFFVEGEKRYGHTISPQSGRPVSHETVSVTVIASSCTLADGWATALNSAGVEAGLKIADDNHIQAVFVYAEEGQLRIVESEAYRHKKEGS